MNWASSEIGTCTAKDFGQVIYMLAGGRGKVAMNAERNLKPVRIWRLQFISTGEISARQKMEEEGHRVVRLGASMEELRNSILEEVEVVEMP